ncbi:MAG: zinc ribbon domain-containing protein [Clostridiales bacterium]|nr:zinc ribbon domain-containing protein [Clostridiales bacterium]
MAFLDKITKATQDVVRGAKDLTDTARQNSLIAEEEKQILNLYTQIGKLYFEAGEFDPETPIGRLCTALSAAKARIAKYQEEIRQIKGTKKCPNCGENIPLSSAFCGVCGTKIEVTPEPEAAPEAQKKFCKACGAELGEGLFCMSCGQKQ